MRKCTASDIQRLLDKDEIRDVIYRYCRGVDRRDREIIAGCYHPDASDDHGDFVVDGQNVADLLTSISSQRTGGGMHLLGNCLVEFDNDSVAYAESYFVSIREAQGEDGNLLRMRGGRYVDRFEKRNQQWKISERVVVDEWHQLARIEGSLEGSDQYQRGRRDSGDSVYEIRRRRVARASKHEKS